MKTAALGTVGLAGGLASSLFLPVEFVDNLTHFGTLALLVALLVVSTCTDLGRLRIPNWATYGTLVLVLSLALVADLSHGADSSSRQLPHALWGASMCFLVMLPVYAMTGRGAGDVKLATAIGSVLGAEMGLRVILLTWLLASIGTLLWMISRVGVRKTLGLLLRSVACVFVPWLVASPGPAVRELMHRPIPLAGFFSLGVLCLWVAQWYQ